MPVEITTALIGIIGILLGAWGGAAISRSATIRATESANQNAIEIMRRQEFSIATAKLRSAFAPTQTKLYLARKSGETNLREFFDNVLPLHGAAIEEFRTFARDGAAYQEAWEEYRKTIYDDDALGDAELRWWSGMVAGEGNEEINNFLDVISQKIEAILHFSKPRQ